jgi:CBS domain containing-hemolysin-like protein
MMLAVLVGLCLLMSFVLAGCEGALLAVSRVRVRHAASEGDARARRLLPLIEDRDAMLGAVTVANHIASLGAFLVMAWKLVKLYGEAGYAVAFLLGLPVFLVGLEVLPKKLFRRYPFRMLRGVVPLLQAVGFFRPLFGGLLRQEEVGDREVPVESAARDDLRTLSALLTRQGQISAGSEGLIGNVLDYRRMRVRDLMVPLRHSVALAPEVPVHVAVELARTNGLEAVPVLGDNGSFIGVFEPALCGPHLPQDRMVRQHMRTLEQVREDEMALRALQRLRKRGRTVALVVTEGEVPCGVVTEEALLRPLLKGRVG